MAVLMAALMSCCGCVRCHGLRSAPGGADRSFEKAGGAGAFGRGGGVVGVGERGV